MQNSSIGLWEIIFSSGSWQIKAMKLVDYCVGGFLVFMSSLVKRSPRQIPQGVKTILVIRPGGIGDAILLLPILKLLKTVRSDRRVDVLCEKRNVAVFLSQGGVFSSVYRYDVAKEFFQVFGQRYDIVIDTEQWHFLSAWIAASISAQYRIGFATRELRGRVFDAAIPYGRDVYELENFKQLFVPMCAQVRDVADIVGSFAVPSSTVLWAEEHRDRKTVSLFVGGSIPERRICIEVLRGVIQHCLAHGMAVVLLGGRDVVGLGAALETQYRGMLVTNFVGKISFEQTAALISVSRVFVGTDSGIMHLAVSVGVPVVAIFGPGNAAKWQPQGTQHVVIRKNISCSPCTRFGYTVPVGGCGYRCMQGILAADICQAVDMLRESGPVVI